MRSTIRRTPGRASRALATAPVIAPLVQGIHVPRARAKYDYREQWMTFTRRVSRALGSGDVARELGEYVANASGATSVAVYLDDADHAYRLAATVGDTLFVPAIDEAAAVPSWLRTLARPVRVPVDLLPSVGAPGLPAALAVSIHWRTALLGFIVLGPRYSGLDYDAEDMDFLATVAEQAAASIAAARLADAAGQPHTMETADRATTAVIHDIKNAVSALSMLARNAADNFSDPEFQRDATITLSHTVERMRRLLVKLSSPEAQTRPSRPEPIDLRELIIEATTPLAADHKVRLVRQLRPVNTVYGDRDALLRVVENLTTNASEAIDHEGTVTVTLVEDEGHAVISVADTGCGIPEEYQERHLFAPFHSTKKDGWGIGLYHTKQMVERQDGEILVESVVGHGTTFTVKLPLRADGETPSLENVR